MACLVFSVEDCRQFDIFVLLRVVKSCGMSSFLWQIADLSCGMCRFFGGRVVKSCGMSSLSVADCRQFKSCGMSSFVGGRVAGWWHV